MKSKAAPTRNQKKFIKDWITYYEKELEVTEFHGDILYQSNDEKRSIEGGEVVTRATTTVDHRYLRADYRIFPALLELFKDKKHGEDEVRSILAHEVSHLATHRLHHLAICVFKDEGETTDAWEALTEKIGRLLVTIGNLKNKKL
jgi:hypothetical protein